MRPNKEQISQLLPTFFDHGEKLMKRLVVLALFWSVSAFAQAGPSIFPQPQPHDFTERNFQFKTGEHMDTHIHYYTLGSPVKGPDGRVGNAVLILHGTGGSGTSLLGPTFDGMLFCSGCLLDATKYFIISPDNLGHGSSSKPSDGMRMGFPITTMTTWSRCSTSCSQKASTSITCDSSSARQWGACSPGSGLSSTPTSSTRPCRGPACQ